MLQKAPESRTRLRKTKELSEDPGWWRERKRVDDSLGDIEGFPPSSIAALTPTTGKRAQICTPTSEHNDQIDLEQPEAYRTSTYINDDDQAVSQLTSCEGGNLKAAQEASNCLP